jgi:cytidylate kinase
MSGVTISAQYGAGGSFVAPAVAERLALPMLDRAISSAVASQLHVTMKEAETGELRRSLVGRFFSVLTPLAGGVLGAGTDAAPPNAITPPDDAALFREQAQEIMTKAMAAGAVILGRGGAVAFRNEPGVLRVRLCGPKHARIAQAAVVENVDVETACRRQPEVDHARAHYVRKLYGVDIDDGSLYHLQIDSTAVPLETCADLIAMAYTSLASHTR